MLENSVEKRGIHILSNEKEHTLPKKIGVKLRVYFAQLHSHTFENLNFIPVKVYINKIDRRNEKSY